MLLTVFEKYIFLQSLGWGIANSLWQAGMLWMIYQLISTSSKKLTPLFRHHLSLLLLLSSFVWFLVTTIQNYQLVKNAGDKALVAGWLNVSENIAISLRYLSIAYIALLLLYSFQFIKHLKGLHLLRQGSFIKAPVDTRIFTEQAALHIGIGKKVSIWLSEKVDVPSVIGFFKPVILLPVTALNNLSTEQAETIILHELAHIKRHDYLVNLLQSFAELILFFNPFAKMLGKAARIERENCCDDWVLNYQYNKHDYATALLVLEQNRFGNIKLALAATNGKKNLLSRVKRLFSAEPSISLSFMQQMKLTVTALVLMVAVFMALPVTSKQASKQQHVAKDITVAPVLASLQTPITNYDGIKNLTIIKEKPEQVVAAKQKVTAIKNVVRKQAEPEEKEYTLALVNEELLKQDQQLQETVIQVADKEPTVIPSLIVKVEEEQSGVKDKTTYLVELKNNNGIAEVKPLLLLNKKMKPLSEKTKAAGKTQLNNTLIPATKKRITS